MPRLRFALLFNLLCLCLACALAGKADTLRRNFVNPPDAARPWVYWYFMDGNQTRAGMHADLEAMKKAGIGGAIMLDVNIGIPQGPVAFMSEEWQAQFAYAVSEAKRLGLQIALGAGPGWCGAGGPWITPELSMQDLVASETSATGPAHYNAVLPRPQPRVPFFGMGTLKTDLHQQWADYYHDEYVIAFPTPAGNARISNTDKKALYYRGSVSSQGEAPRLPSPVGETPIPGNQCIPVGTIINLTGKLAPDGRLFWDVPAGNWTIMRFGRTTTGQTTRPAPAAGLGFESDKFSRAALDAHFHAYEDPLLRRLGPDSPVGDSGLTMLHFDSWEMSSQNWSAQFRQEFIKRCGYDPLPYLPAMTGHVVGSVEQSERFLWDLRQTASALLIQNQADYLAQYAHAHRMTLSLEPYDLNPSADLDLGSAADLPMGEFWSRGFGPSTVYSCTEAVSVGHTNGRRIIGAEAFTASAQEAWQQYPGSMKEQLDWALCDGINKFVIHRYQHQPDLDKFPGMTMGRYGVHWERTQTWWDLVPAFHRYISRASEMLRQGLPVADILYLTPEGAPQVFTPPPSALAINNGYSDRRGYSFDGCSPKTLMAHALVNQGRIAFPDGMSYRLLVLPESDTMTPELLRKIIQLVRAGAAVVGAPPRKSPSLINYPASDTQVRTLATQLWGKAPYAPQRIVGKGRIFVLPTGADRPMDQARWIWFSEGSPASNAPVGTRYFRTTVNIPSGHAVKTADATMTADNAYELFVNGHRAGSGDDFHMAGIFNIKPWLKPGLNDIRVTAINSGDGPNPAGLIGAFAVAFADGSTQRFFTDAHWQSAQAAGGPQSPALELGPAGMKPWLLSEATKPLYPDYAVTADLLKHMGIAPDFSAAAPMRYIHRRLSDGDLYFVANTSIHPLQTTCTLRTAGRQPEWWNPITGVMRDLPNCSTSNGLTHLPIRLGSLESGFVVFRKPISPTTGTEINFPRCQSIATLSSPWMVSFDPKWGGPASVIFSTLDDWSKRPEPGIKYYSGKATYKTEFTLPSDAVQSPGVYALDLGNVKDLASVRLNGHNLGVVWCAPWRVSIPTGLLHPTGNRLEITVANLWVNRLIGDAGKPQAQRLTSTTGNTYTPASALQPSGLLGPVTVNRSNVRYSHAAPKRSASRPAVSHTHFKSLAAASLRSKPR